MTAQGQLWTPLPFHDEEAAKAYLARHAIGDHQKMLRTHKIVPVRIRLTARAQDGETRG